MISSAWIASVVGFLRDHRRRVVAAAGAVLAILIAAWWSEALRGVPKPSRIDSTATAARSRSVPNPFAALPKLQSMPLGQSGRLRQQFVASGLKTSQAAEQWRAEKQRRLQLSQAQKPAQ